MWAWRTALVLRRALLTGQIASTLQPTLAKAIARRAVVNHLEVVAIRIVGVTGCGAPRELPAWSETAHLGWVPSVTRNT